MKKKSEGDLQENLNHNKFLLLYKKDETRNFLRKFEFLLQFEFTFFDLNHVGTHVHYMTPDIFSIIIRNKSNIEIQSTIRRTCKLM